tara:strand:+ start:1601 stop:1852 length:252 start_codon:yes stop_codon:yes gene_type:complete
LVACIVSCPNIAFLVGSGFNRVGNQALFSRIRIASTLTLRSSKQPSLCYTSRAAFGTGKPLLYYQPGLLLVNFITDKLRAPVF